jgi:hypothetical protein
MTNELLTQAQDTDYLYNAINGIVPQPNVIYYYASGNTADTPIAVYANSAELYAGPVSWVDDGRAILDITDGGASWDLVYRDGTLVHLDGMEGLEFAGGTPDGWFAIGEEGGIPALFHYDINTLEATLVAPGNANAVSVRMSSLPALGGSIESPSFAAFPLPDVAQTALCPEFLPSRLVIGQYGQVTPGEPNRMRAAPSTDGELIGEIPAEATFLVLEGPICDVINQTPWWRVEYDGTEGWTVEGQGDTYWTEPVE